MEVIILATPADVCATAAAIVANCVRQKADAVLGLPTGETPKPFYAALIELKLDLRRVTTFNLDEYVGLSEDHPKSFHRYMRDHFLDRAEVGAAHLLDGLVADLALECARYEAAIAAAGGMDLVVLGLGTEGHIGFNEPTSSLSSRTRLKTLTRATLARAGIAAHETRHAITMGISTILGARRCLLIACGAAKAPAVAAMIEGPLTALVPASALQQHPRTTVVVDEAAAQALKRKDYYREVFAGKPAWQRQRDGT